MFKRILFIVILLLNTSTIVLSASTETTEQKNQITEQSTGQQANNFNTVEGRLKEGIRNGTSENLNKWLVDKGNQLYSTIKASTVLYFVIVVATFLICMFVGIFVKKMIGWGFFLLVLGTVVYILINFMPDILSMIVGEISQN